MNKKQKKVLWRIILSAVLLGLLLLLGWLIPLPRWSMRLLVLIPYGIIGYDVLRKAALGVVHGEVFDENFLMAVATVGAMILGEYTEGVAVMLFYQVGELFQSVAVGKSRRSITDLMDIRPDIANLLLEDGTTEEADPDDVEIGSLLLVRPGEKVPIDGVVTEGVSTLNTAALTGESLPREVHPGDEIISGCVNMSGLLKIRTTREFGDSTVAKILDLVENSSMKKARVEQFITRFAHYYTPAVCYAALALALLPPLVFGLTGQGWPFATWVIRALNFLVISCPCALVVSIPLSFFGGIGGASRQGILVKGANYLEALASTGIIVFDKTGTLTRGSFSVSRVMLRPGVDEAELLRQAAIAEQYSSHPVARSLLEAAQIEPTPADVEEIAGHGIRATVEERQILVGNAKLMELFGVDFVPCDEPGTVIYVARDGAFLGSVLISDALKPQARQAIRDLKASGVRRTVMLTGDGEAVSAQVAGQVGVDEYHAELLPADKVEWVELLLQDKGKKEHLAFVGDGINDAPVLSRADVGVAMGALGSDAAIEAADIVLMDDDPSKIGLAMRISRKCLTIVRQNIVFALLVKAVCLVLSAFGIANMWWAVFADVGVMVLAVLNAARTLKID